MFLLAVRRFYINNARYLWYGILIGSVVFTLQYYVIPRNIVSVIDRTSPQGRRLTIYRVNTIKLRSLYKEINCVYL